MTTNSWENSLHQAIKSTLKMEIIPGKSIFFLRVNLKIPIEIKEKKSNKL